ncbi:MAG: hypothetical protein ACREUF_06260 [Solimonas sp.]
MIDGSQFLRGLDLAERRVRDAAEQAMAQAGLDVLHDAIFEEPTVPFEKGTLRASGSVILATPEGEELVATSQGMTDLREGAAPPSPAEPPVGESDPNAIIVLVAFNTPYAARLHEHPEFHFTEPGAGGKYVEDKLVPKMQELMARVAARIRAALGG